MSTLLYKLADYFQNHMHFDFRQEIINFYSEDLETGYKLFFNPPSKSELEILELQLSVGNNLCYIEQI